MYHRKDFKIGSTGESYYIYIATGVHYLHKDGKVRYGMRLDLANNYFRTKSEAQECLDKYYPDSEGRRSLLKETWKFFLG